MVGLIEVDNEDVVFRFSKGLIVTMVMKKRVFKCLRVQRDRKSVKRDIIFFWRLEIRKCRTEGYYLTRKERLTYKDLPNGYNHGTEIDSCLLLTSDRPVTDEILVRTLGSISFQEQALKKLNVDLFF